MENTHQQVRGKGIVMDQDGFQQVQNQRGIRRNIFDDVNDEARQHALEQRTIARKYINQAQSRVILVKDATESRLENQQGKGNPGELARIAEAWPGVTMNTGSENKDKTNQTAT